MNGITIKTNYKILNNLIDINRSKMQEISDYSMSLMKKRIKSGFDKDGVRMIEYSPAYARRKRLLGKQTKNVDMNLSGTMINGIKSSATSKNEAEISVTDHSKIGLYHQTGVAKGGKLRKWFGFTKDTQNKVYTFIRKILDVRQ